METDFLITDLYHNGIVLHIAFLDILNITQVNIMYHDIKIITILLITITTLREAILTCLPQTDLHRWETIRGGFHSCPLDTVNESFVIPQIDGNASLNTSLTSVYDSNESSVTEKTSNIGIQIGFRPPKSSLERGPAIWKRIKRDNKKIQALSLPVIVNYNMRSFFPKQKNFCQDMIERDVDVAFFIRGLGKK